MEEYRQLFKLVLLAAGEALMLLGFLGIFFRGWKAKNPPTATLEKKKKG